MSAAQGKLRTPADRFSDCGGGRITRYYQIGLLHPTMKASWTKVELFLDDGIDERDLRAGGGNSYRSD